LDAGLDPFAGDLGLDMQPFCCILFLRVEAVFKALANESRRKLLDQLQNDNGQTLTQLCGHLDMTRQAVAKHLALLEAANLVATVWRGREKLHYLNPAPLHEIYERWIGKYERHRLQALSDLKKGLEEDNKAKHYGQADLRLRHAH
jgi:DNA-binding transcriptional ArsR family regulator